MLSVALYMRSLFGEEADRAVTLLCIGKLQPATVASDGRYMAAKRIALPGE